MKYKDILTNKLDDIQVKYENEIDNIADDVFQNGVVPFCKSRDWIFISGNGSYWLGDDTTHFSGSDLGLDTVKNDHDLKNMIEILETPVLNGQCIGSLMSDYKGD